MSKLLPVVWTKGVFLSPQHLQAQDRFFQELLAFRLGGLTFCGWGFTELSIDGSGIASGILAITSCSGLFPDHLAFDTAQGSPLPRARSLEECLPEGKKQCAFFLAVPQHREGGLNIGSERGGLSTRFFSELQLFKDETGQASGERPVALARNNLTILAEGETMEGSVLLPLALVERSEAGLYQLSSTFVPPLLDIACSSYLLDILRGIVELLVARSNQLAGARRQRNESLADFSASDIANFWLLYTLNTELPGLRHLLGHTRVHPETLFTAMLRLAGSLTTFSSQIEARDLPRYDHENLGTCFSLLDSLLRDLLNTVVPNNFIAVPLKTIHPTVYAAAIDKDEYLRTARFYLAVSSTIGRGELITRFPLLAKVGSSTQIEDLIRQALSGLRLVHVPVPPRAIPVHLDYQYFSIEASGLIWESVVRARNLAVYAPGELGDPRMELIILPQ
ncbi:type VI secretion system baseplate subunit TssK [Granulicella sp. dw_53]|uniref:type VI secretion system baseplate subunit TssK n=1 Tax=Granulicella sp. dw_53 TaxID=2719792 RepID=UPI001BD2D2C9|nr:type VI secretion system baseplate subunit TssK [Granulicella sp. dw_53]